MALDLNIGFPLAERHAPVEPARQRDLLAPATLPHGTVTAIAMLAHATCLWLLGDVLGSGLATAQCIAAIAACVALYGVKALIAYRTRGPWRWYLGLLPFLASCGFGIAGSVLLALLLTSRNVDWFVAGLCGAAFGLWWNQGAVDRHGWSTR